MADDVASLGFAIDSSPLVAATVAQDKLSAASKNLESNVIRLNTANAASATQTKKMAAETALAEKEIGKLSEVAAVVESRMVGLGASMGMMGAVMQTIGPYGIAAAAGLGVLIVAIEKMVEAANRMGEFSRVLSDSAQTIGMNTDQLQALNIAAESVGLSADANSAAFGRFTVELSRLRDGTGTLFTELESVDAGLTRQLASTRDVTDAIDLLAKAYASATDQAKKNAIAQAAFGRGGLSEGRVLTAIDSAGGLAAYKAGLTATDALTQDQIKHWAELSIEIEHATNLAKNNIASIFTGPMLEAEKKFAETFLDISRAAKDFKPSDSLLRMLSLMSGLPIIGIPAMIAKGVVSGMTGPSDMQGPPMGPTFDQRAGGLFGGSSAITTKPQFDLAEMKLWASFMGSALTAQQQLAEKTLTLKAAFAALSPEQQASTVMLGRYKAALDVLNLESVIAVESKRNSILGELASVEDLVKEKQDGINLSVKQGVTFTTEEMRNIQERNRLLIEASKIENQMIFDRQQLFKTQGDQSVDALLRANGIPPASDRAAAIRDYMRMTDALKQMNDVGGTFASGFLTDISHGVSAVDSLHNALTRLADTLIDMAARQLVSSALGSLASSLLGPSVVPGTFGHNAMGNVFNRGILMPYAMGGIVNQPTFFPMANGAGLMGEAGPEAIMPLKRGPSGQLGVSGVGGASVIHHTSIQVDARGSTMTESQYISVTARMIKANNQARDRAAPNRMLNG